MNDRHIAEDARLLLTKELGVDVYPFPKELVESQVVRSKYEVGFSVPLEESYGITLEDFSSKYCYPAVLSLAEVYRDIGVGPIGLEVTLEQNNPDFPQQVVVRIYILFTLKKQP